MGHPLSLADLGMLSRLEEAHFSIPRRHSGKEGVTELTPQTLSRFGQLGADGAVSHPGGGGGPLIRVKLTVQVTTVVSNIQL